MGCIHSVATPSIEDNKQYSDLWAISLETNELVQLTNDVYSESNPSWSPDSKRLAYISNKEKTPQAYIMDFPQGGIKKVSFYKNGASNLRWSSKGALIAYTTDVKMKEGLSDIYPQLPKADVRIYDSLPVRHWDEWEDNMYNHLFVSFADGRTSLDLTLGAKYDIPMKPYGGREEIAFPLMKKK